MKLDHKIKAQYQGEKGKEYHDTKHSVSELVYHWVARLRRDKLIPYLSENDIILEYGVGTGWNIAQLKCKKRIGFDIAEHLEPILLKQNIQFINDINAIPDESINVVVCHHVLEHTGSPTDILEEIKRILSKNGKLLLFVPYEYGKKYRHYNPQEPNHHLYSWNVQTLGNLIAKLDLKVINGSTRLFGYDRFSSVWAEKLHIGEFGFRLLRRLIHLLKPEYEVLIVAAKE